MQNSSKTVSALGFVLFFYSVHLSPKPKLLLLGDKMCFNSITQLLDYMAILPIFS